MIHKTTRSILSVLLAALLLVASTSLTPAFAGDGGSVSLQSESAEGRVLAGTGTEGDPYQIATANDLREFADKVNNQNKASAWAILTADIDLSGICSEESGTSWTPIGTSSSNPYSGTFNGAGHTISGLYINRSADYQGLFGYVSTDGDNIGTVKDLSVSGSVSGHLYVGGIAGQNNGNVINCAFSGSVKGSGNYVGGVVGQNSSSGTVKNCYNTGNISGNGSVGGVVGDNVGRVENCYNTGTVTGTNDYVGGVVGYNGSIVKNCYNTGAVNSSGNYVGGVVGENPTGRVENSYNTGAVSGGEYVGGVVGYNHSGGSVTNCYNIGAVSGGEDVGGVVGYNISSVTNCYNTGEVSGNQVGGIVGYNYSGGSVTGCYFLQQDPEIPGIGNDEDAEDAKAVDDLDALCDALKGDTWTISDTLKRPVLTSNHEDDGSEDHPYEIFTATQLENFRDLVNRENGNPAAWAVLMENIDLEGSEEWTPIGNSEENAYTGTFDGNGKTIENLYIKNTSSDYYQGLFGYLDQGGTVQNLNVSGSVSVSHGENVGGIVGYNFSGTVTNCAFSGSVGGIFSGSYVGGIVGYNSSGTVTNCAFSGSVSGSVSGNYVGGVVGYNNGGTVTGCIFSGSGSVSGGSYVGGVVGRNDGTVKNCYNTVSGTVSGSGRNVGGVVGDNGGSVINCTNTGSVKGSGNSVGGVVGYNQSGSSVTTCYNTGTVSGSDYVGGVVGENSGSNGVVENCHNAGKVSGRNVGGVVGDNGGSVKNCYNTDSVSDGTTSGGVVGQNSGSVTNCYFLPTTEVNNKLQGIGGGSGTSSNVEPRTADAFHSGEVAWLLQAGQTDGSSQVWGQSNLKDKNSWPTLVALDKNAKPVYKVAFISDNTEIEAQYANSGMTVGSPTTNPTKEGYTFAGWFTKSSGGSQWNFSTAVTENMTLYAQWTPVEEPEPTPTPTPDPEPSGPSTGDSTGWDDIRDELENTAKGDEITIDMGDETKVPAEIFESLAGKDVDVTFDLGDIQWSVNGADIPTDTDFTDLDLGVNLDTHGIPVNVINTITGEVGTVQITLAHNGEFGFTMTLSAPLGKENAGYWANLYHYDEDAEALNFEAAAKVDEDGSVTIPFSHASQYAIVIDTHSHATVDVSDLFIDIAPDAWYKDAVQYAYDNGLMTGVSDTEFAPEATTTRAMIVSILARLEGVESAQAAGFADVDDNDWYATAVNWAANVGVVNGYEDNTFRPNTPITREQLAAILMNYASYKGEDVSNRADLTSYTDQPSTWAEEAMQWAVAEGLISGVTNDQLQPQGNATRAQVAAILQRFLDK